MTTCLGKSCSFGFLCQPLVSVCQSMCVLLPLLAFGSGMLDLIVLIPNYYLSIDFV